MNPLDNILDVDSHEMVPSHMWGEVFGPASAQMEEILKPVFILQEDNNDFYRPEIKADDTAMSDENVWTIRGVKAPGSFDLDRRLDAMNLMGIDKQIIFPSCALFAFGQRAEIGEIARNCIQEYNSWVARITNSQPRLRPVAILAMDGSVDDAVREAERLVEIGVRAVMVGINTPPCGMSPAATEMDRIWSIMERENIAVMGHIAENGFLKADNWMTGAPTLSIEKNISLEVGFSPYVMSILHYPAMNYLTTLVLGGVFERFPKLRFGMMEFGAAWYGEFAENLDVWAGVFKRRLEADLSMTPSQYLNRNVRVTPFHFEPVDMYLARHPGLVESYCYASDYPHFEGGKRSKNTAFNKIERLGPDIVQKYFVDNASLLLPA